MEFIAKVYILQSSDDTWQTLLILPIKIILLIQVLDIEHYVIILLGSCVLCFLFFLELFHY